MIIWLVQEIYRKAFFSFCPLYPEMLVYDYLRYVASIRNLDRDFYTKRMKNLVGICGLEAVMHRPFRELSRGYKQRVGLAHAMMSDPEILILDEPTSGLDPNQIVDIRSIIRETGREKTIIFSTHILSEAEATCDRIVIIDQGKIVADGTAQSVKTSMAGNLKYQISLLNAQFTEVKTGLSDIPGVEEIERLAGESPDELKIEVMSTRDNRKEIYQIIKNKNWFLIGFTEEQGTLESTFRRLTQSGKRAPETELDNDSRPEGNKR